MFTGSTLGPVSAGFGALRKEEEAQPKTLPGLSQPKFFAIPTSPALLLVCPFLWVFALFGEQVFSMWEPLFFFFLVQR